MEYIFSLGSNMGNREEFIKKGTAFLSTLGRFIDKSSTYKTTPVGMTAKARSFYNSIVIINSGISPEEMLSKIKEFEKISGRNLDGSHNRPRTMDIDILFAGNIVINTRKLQIPHKEIEKRKFVLLPLSEIRANFRHPVLGKKVSDMLRELASNEKVVKISEI